MGGSGAHYKGVRCPLKGLQVLIIGGRGSGIHEGRASKRSRVGFTLLRKSGGETGGQSGGQTGGKSGGQTGGKSGGQSDGQTGMARSVVRTRSLT